MRESCFGDVITREYYRDVMFLSIETDLLTSLCRASNWQELQNIIPRSYNQYESRETKEWRSVLVTLFAQPLHF